jgi:biopolymer transport protein ExbB
MNLPTLPLADPFLCLAAAPPDPLPSDVSLLHYIQTGGLIGYILILLSVTALAFVIRNLIILRASRLAPPEIVERLEPIFQRQDVDAALALCSAPENRAYLTDILRRALSNATRSPLGFLEFKPALEEAGQIETNRLHQLNDGIGIIAAVGPMLGLLGTVIGMIGAFRSIGSLEGAARSSELAKYMSLALVNTAEGLVVAIPCTVAFALFRRRIDALVMNVADVIEHLTSSLTDIASAPKPPARPAGAPAPLPPGAPLPGAHG